MAPRLAGKLGTGGTLTLTAFVEAVSLLGIGLSPNAWTAGLGEVVLGAAMGATMGLGPAVRQAIVPDHLMGRVAATGRLIALGAGPVGAVFGGWLAHVAGLRAPFIVGAGILAGYDGGRGAADEQQADRGGAGRGGGAARAGSCRSRRLWRRTT